jgi:hypothetical protein
MIAPLIYMVSRASGEWSGEQLVNIAGTVAGQGRADSLQGRLDSEDKLTAKALERPYFGWGGYGRSLVATPDGFWVLEMGRKGLLGLVSITAALMLPGAMLVARLPAGEWFRSAAAPVAALAVVLAIYMIDNLFNAMVNPVFVLVAGGLTGFACAVGDARRATARAAQPAPGTPRPLPPAGEYQQ